MNFRFAVALSVVCAVLPPKVTGSVDAAELHRVVTAFFYAIGENRLEEAMSFYHEDSPQADEVRQELAFGRTAYLQRTSTLSFTLLSQSDQHAVVRATHRHLRITGIKFVEEYVKTRYVLRRQSDTWKLWSLDDRSL